MSVVGFDIGNAFSKIAVTKNKNIQMVPNDLSKLSTPTLVTYSNKDRHFGEQSLSTWSRNPRTTIYGLKRLLGRNYNDPTLSQESKDFIFYPMKQLDEQGHIGIQVPTSHIGKDEEEDKILAPEQILGSFLAKLKEFTHKYMDNMPIKDCVIACPAYFDDAQRRALLTAARLAELNVLRLINETTAIALQYGILRPLPKDSTRRVIFMDIGESDTQVAVVDFIQGQLTVKKTNFIDCGGRDFDLSLYQYLVQKFESQHKHINLNDYPRARLRLIREASNIKKLLSGNRDAVVTLECLVEDLDIQLHITREEFENLNEQNLKKIIIPLEQMLNLIQTDNIEIHSIEIVGGVSRVPAIQDKILNCISKFDPKINKLMTTLNGDEACARGAALMCAMLSPNFKVREFQVRDINTWPISLNYLNDKNEKTMDIILKSGDPQPCTSKITFQKQNSFDFELEYPTDAKIDENNIIHIDYPLLTNRKIGVFRCSIPELSLNLVQEPKIKLMLNLNKHCLVEWPECIFIEYVKKEEKKEIKKAPEVSDNNNNNKVEEKKDNNNNNNVPEPMEVDAKEQAPSDKPSEPQAQSSDSQSQPSADASSNKPTPMETDDVNEGSDSKDDKDGKSQNKDKQRDKRKVTRALVITGKFSNEITNELFNQWMELEAHLLNNDRVIHETAEKRNELESYVYTLRNKLEGEFNDYVKAEDKEKYLIHLDEINNWIYDEGDNSQKSSFIDKLKDLHAIGDPIGSKHWEWTHRPQRIEHFKKLINRYLNFVDSQDEQYSHIEQEEKDKIRKATQEMDQWLFQEQQKQDKLAKYEMPSFTCAQIDNKYRELMNLSEPIVNKPKPKPKPKEPTPTPANADSNANANANPNANPNPNPNENANANANANAEANNNNNQQQQQQPLPEENKENESQPLPEQVDPMEVE